MKGKDTNIYKHLMEYKHLGANENVITNNNTKEIEGFLSNVTQIATSNATSIELGMNRKKLYDFA